MPGKIFLKSHIIRENLQRNPNILFVFGDNMLRIGLGGQAKEMRGEPNAIGIPTKWSPHITQEAYFANWDLLNPRVRIQIDNGFDKLEEHLRKNGHIVFPQNGIGTGLSQLEFRAPEILKYIELRIRQLYQITEEN